MIIERKTLIEIVNQWEDLEHQKQVEEIWIVQDDASKYMVTDQDPEISQI